MKLAIITGASSGMGREAALQIADRFSGLEEIWLVARREELLENLKKQLPVPARVLPLDLTKEEDLACLEETFEREKPQVKILVNAAGIGRMGPIGSGTLAEESGMVRLNCQALCAMTHLALPYMARNSRILQFASASAFLPQPGFAVYAATKAFVLSYSRALNQELKGRKIVVTAVCPGPVDTEFFQTDGMRGPIPAYKRMTMANPRRVVKKALRDSMMGKTVSVYGLFMNLFRAVCKVLPHGWILGALGNIQGKNK